MRNYEEMPGAVLGLGVINLGTNLRTAFSKEDASCCIYMGHQGANSFQGM